ncbi:helix-turn-helix transcriptional regulator [Microbulbifer sp. SSSA002]|uniref:helix-turn-helix transcriptional regulator n=1 Tax=Microbulbifer sp. SSSA002 TaxID=3243376 RepID=UPI004039E07F
MCNLIQLARSISSKSENLPFSVYSSNKEQCIANVPVIKPLLIFVLSGSKELGKNSEVTCKTGSFVFLSNSPKVDMRNIPDNQEYFAILLEFDYSDFEQFHNEYVSNCTHVNGKITKSMKKSLFQFIEWSALAPAESIHYRRKEMLQLIYMAGYTEISQLVQAPSLSHKVFEIISSNVASKWCVEDLASRLAMSESTLRRKLKAEGSSTQAIKSRARLGHGLHLIQTTMDQISSISERCGYQSQSRFTEQFKTLFGITPSELRKTRLNDFGEEMTAI